MVVNAFYSDLGRTLNVVVLQQMDVSAHVGDGSNVDHDRIFERRIPLLVKSASKHHLDELGENL